MRINISHFEKVAQVNIVKQRTFLFLTKLGSDVNSPTSHIFVNVLRRKTKIPFMERSEQND